MNNKLSVITAINHYQSHPLEIEVFQHTERDDKKMGC